MAEREDLVLLHGFAGTHRTWDGVLSHLPVERYRPLVLDLPGHGELADVTRSNDGGVRSSDAGTQSINFRACVASVLERSPERFVLCGYSLGGRIALHVALAAPERVTRLVLVASSPGIADAAERAERRAADRVLADAIEREPIEWFVERWCAQPMFAADPAGVAALARADYMRNRPRALAAVLRGIGNGEMQPLWDRLPELSMPVTVLSGERDAKFQAIGLRMIELLCHARARVAAGGHRLPLESPEAVAAEIAAETPVAETP